MKNIPLLLLLSSFVIALIYFSAGSVNRGALKENEETPGQIEIGDTRQEGPESLSGGSDFKPPQQFNTPTLDERRSASLLRESYRQALRNEESPSGGQRESEGAIATAAETSRTEKNTPDQTTEGGTILSGSSERLTGATAQQRLWLPAAMLEPDDSIAISMEMQVAAWEELQNNFVEVVDGRIPSDDAGKANWIKAQQENDDLFRLKFGWDAFNAQQLKAYREGLAPQQP